MTTPSAMHSQNGRGPRSQEWGTNPDTFAMLNAEFNFDLDAAALGVTALLPTWLGPGSPFAEDALSVPWNHGPNWPGRRRIYLNPPYSRDTIHDWVGKVLDEAPKSELIYLLPAGRVETKWFGRCFDSPYCHELRFAIGRERYRDPDLDFEVGQAAGFPTIGLLFYPVRRALPFPVPRRGL